MPRGQPGTGEVGVSPTDPPLGPNRPEATAAVPMEDSMAKIIQFGRGRTPPPRVGHEPARRRGPRHARPQGPQRRARQEVGRPDDHQRRRLPIAKEIELEDPYENIGARWSRRSPKTDDVAGDGNHHRHSARLVDGARGAAQPRRRCQPGRHQAGASRPPSTPRSPRSPSSPQRSTSTRSAQVAPISAADAEIGNADLRRHRKVGKDGVITVRGEPDLRHGP